ncbi:hypothetical protein ACHAXH_001782, partial [Discostella pseudostelligera]
RRACCCWCCGALWYLGVRWIGGFGALWCLVVRCFGGRCRGACRWGVGRCKCGCIRRRI